MKTPEFTHINHIIDPSSRLSVDSQQQQQGGDLFDYRSWISSPKLTEPQLPPPPSPPSSLSVDLSLTDDRDYQEEVEEDDEDEDAYFIPFTPEVKGGRGDEVFILPDNYWLSLLSSSSEAAINTEEPTEIESQISLLSVENECIVRAPVCPFFQRIRYGFFDVVKIAFGTVFILPVRAVTMLSMISLAWSLSFLLTMFRTEEELETQPMSAWRRALRWMICRCLMRVVFFCVGFEWVIIKGQRSTSADAPIVVAAPHSSYFDSLALLFGGIPTPSVVARSETKNELFTSQLVKMLQSVFVSRDSRESRANTVHSIRDRVDRILAAPHSWPQLLMYPEGTCGNRSSLMTFKTGAFIPGVPVQPLLVKYPNRKDYGTWTFDGIGFKQSLWLSLTQVINYCELEFLPIYVPNAEERANPNLYAENVRKKMAEALEVPTCEYVYEDGVAMNHLNKHEIIGKLKGIAKFRKSANVSPLVEIAVMKGISSNIHGRNEIYANEEAFASDFLHLASSPDFDPEVVDKLFTFLHKKDDLIDKREYLIYACILNTVTRVDKLMPGFFLMYTRGNRRMNFEEFKQFASTALVMTDDAIAKFFVADTRPRISTNDTIDLATFTRKTQKLLEYLKLLGLEVQGLLTEYPPREREINHCKGVYSTGLRKRSD